MLARILPASKMGEVMLPARLAAALSGSVYSDVGTATHYHANYVFPYWAPSLAKVALACASVVYRISASASVAFRAACQPYMPSGARRPAPT